MSKKQVFIHLDSAESIFFSRELEYIKKKSYDVKNNQIRYSEYFPVSTEAGEGAETITYEQFDKVGVTKIIHNYSSDLPAVDVKGDEYTQSIRSLGNYYTYSRQEIRAAKFANKRLQDRKAKASMRSNEEKTNDIAWFGDTANKLVGFLTAPNVPLATVATGAGGVTWDKKTPDEILADMNTLVNGIVDLTNGIEKPDTLLLPIDQYTLISNTARSSTSDTTILEFFIRNSPFINKVDWAIELKGAGTAGADMMVAYRKDPDAFTFEIPMPYTVYAPQEDGLAYKINTESRVGGVIVYYPLSISKAEGI
jgi:hypothetical protein